VRVLSFAMSVDGYSAGSNQDLSRNSLTSLNGFDLSNVSVGQILSAVSEAEAAILIAEGWAVGNHRARSTMFGKTERGATKRMTPRVLAICEMISQAPNLVTKLAHDFSLLHHARLQFDNLLK
jgi:hypothetical protein